jgi:N-ethylmaleimide reductase
MSKLFEPAPLGPVTLGNRIVMAPMTRSRAIGNVPNDLMVEYYSSRAGAGLIVTEGTSPSPNGLGYARIPGLYNREQTAGWRKVTDAVHAKGGRIFVQLMHTGRASHPTNMPRGARVLAPSAIALSGTMWTDSEGMQPHPTPEAMSEQDVLDAIGEYVRSAELSVEAGFDGIELHAANGYLIEQFLNPNVNQRTDAYGATAEGRMKFLLDIADACARKIGAHRVGVRVSPHGTFNDTGAFEGVDEFYTTLAERLSKIGVAYLHVVDHSSMGAPTVSDELKQTIRERFKGTFILSGGYETSRAEQDLAANKGDLVAFGRPFIANPDLVDKLAKGLTLREGDPTKFYTPGADGYTVFE